jgi:MinD superfamily P-loop ATPase
MIQILAALATLSTAGWVYQVDPALCNGCGICIPWCPLGAISMAGPDAVIDPSVCDACGICAQHCLRGAIYLTWYSSSGDPGEAAVRVAPCPASGCFTVTAPAGSLVRVYSTDGRIVREVVSGDSGAMVDAAGLPPGVYPVTLGLVPVGAAVLR